MIFDTNQVYSAPHAELLHVGDKVILADSMAELRDKVEQGVGIQTLTSIKDDGWMARFEYVVDDEDGEGKHPVYMCLAYLVKSVTEPDIRPFKSNDELRAYWFATHSSPVIWVQKRNDMADQQIITGFKHMSLEDYSDPEDCVCVDSCYISLQQLLDDYMFEDLMRGVVMPRISVQTEYDKAIEHLSLSKATCIWKLRKGICNEAQCEDCSVCEKQDTVYNAMVVTDQLAVDNKVLEYAGRMIASIKKEEAKINSNITLVLMLIACVVLLFALM